MKDLFSCYASAAFGLEGLVAAELRELGMREVKAENGGVRFDASPEELFLCNLQMHFCERIFIIAAEQKCLSFEDLFQLVLSVPWEEYAHGDEAFNVSAKCARSRLMSPRDCQSITKKAIIERLRREKKQQFFPEKAEPLFIHVSIHSDTAKILINTSGEALSRRGYRTWNGEAPIRETLAAALVQLSPWQKHLPLYDPCCGTGTILIEAALISSGRAPGLYRHFAMEHLHPFRFLRYSELRERIKDNTHEDPLQIAGSDISADAIDLAGRHIRQAKVTNMVSVSCAALQDLQLKEENGVFICNPPYGERLSDLLTCRKLYRELKALKDRHPSWSMCVISSDPAFERFYGKRAERKRRLYNGRLECTFYIFP